MKIAFIFPGQGAQTVGMGKDVADAYPAAAGIFRTANEIVGYDLAGLCFEGPAEKLNSTTISQPAIFTVSAAILEALRAGSRPLIPGPDVTAGLSLGEYTALYAAGVVNFPDTLRLVQERGQAMQAAADASEGTMLSIIGLDDQKLKDLIDEAAGGELLAAVNFNCPGQIVLSGTKAACQRAQALAEKYGALKAVPLAVAGAFHTEMMAPAADQLRCALETTGISKPDDIKIIANTNAEYYQSTAHIKEGLVDQLTQPVLWQKCIEKLIADGVEQFYEIGPGRVLTGLTKRINRKSKITNVSTAQTVSQLT